MLDLLRPRRELVIPALVVAGPLLYFLFREVGMREAGGAEGGSRDLSLAVGALAAGYLGSVVVTAFLDVDALASESPVARLVFRPEDAALVVFAVLFLVAVGYLAATTVVEIPSVVETLATPLGFLLGLPLVLIWGATMLVGKSLGREPASWVQVGVVGAGIALSVLWTAALATGVAIVLG